jgi:hypothetical protein
LGNKVAFEKMVATVEASLVEEQKKDSGAHDTHASESVGGLTAEEEVGANSAVVGDSTKNACEEHKSMLEASTSTSSNIISPSSMSQDRSTTSTEAVAFELGFSGNIASDDKDLTSSVEKPDNPNTDNGGDEEQFLVSDIEYEESISDAENLIPIDKSNDKDEEATETASTVSSHNRKDGSEENKDSDDKDSDDAGPEE